jgi:hypothetical protein
LLRTAARAESPRQWARRCRTASFTLGSVCPASLAYRAPTWAPSCARPWARSAPPTAWWARRASLPSTRPACGHLFQGGFPWRSAPTESTLLCALVSSLNRWEAQEHRRGRSSGRVVRC